MAGRVLADIEADERRAERGDATQDIGQPAVGEQRLTGVDQRTVAQIEGVAQLAGGHVMIGLTQPRGEVAQYRAVRFARPAGRVAQLRRRRCDGQLAGERVELARVERRRQRAGRGARLARDLRGDRGVAVAVAANPRAEDDGGRRQRQPPSGQRGERPIQRAEAPRQRIPQRLLEDVEAAADLVHRLRLLPPHVLRPPHRQDLAAERGVDFVALERAQVRTIAPFERARQTRVRRRERAARNRGGMRGHDERDLHVRRRAMQILRRRAGLEDLREDVLERSALAARGVLTLVIAPATHAMVLLGDVGEREEMSERASHRHGHLDGQIAQRFLQLRHRVRRPLPRVLRRAPDPLDGFVERHPFARANRVAQHLAEHRDVFPEPPVGIAHGSRCWARRNAPTVGKNAGSLSLA